MTELTAAEPFTGVFPIAPTPFTEAGDLDLEGQRRVLDCMSDQGVDGICILANYSEQFALSDSERDILLDLCLSHVAGRVPVIVTASHYGTRIVVERARRAAAAGATGTMPSALLPDLIKPVVIDYLGGRTDAAAAAYSRILPLINFENRQCNLRAAKAVMMAGGVIASDAVRHPFAPLDDATRAGLLALARDLDPLALRWGK